MQILSNALPGFRDLRGPVIAGYVWLLFVWLIVRPDLDTRPSTLVGGALWDLGHQIGRLGVVIAVSVAAYLIGSISQEISRVLRGAWNRVARAVGQVREVSVGIEIAGMITLAEPEFHNQQILDDERRATAILYDHEDRLGDNFSEVQFQVNRRTRQARTEAQRELTLPATLLVGEQEQLFAEVDRLRAEGELRFAVVPPLFALLILLTTMQSSFWLLGIPAVVVLFSQGILRETDSRKVIADAIDRGLIESSASKKFAAWVDTLPKRIESIEAGNESIEAGTITPPLDLG
jgi:hypothetical protein